MMSGILTSIPMPGVPAGEASEHFEMAYEGTTSVFRSAFEVTLKRILCLFESSVIVPSCLSIGIVNSARSTIN